MTKFNVIFRSDATGSEIYSEHDTLEQARAALDTVNVGDEVTFDGVVVGTVSGAWIEDENGNGY